MSSVGLLDQHYYCCFRGARTHFEANIPFPVSKHHHAFFLLVAIIIPGIWS